MEAVAHCTAAAASVVQAIAQICFAFFHSRTQLPGAFRPYDIVGCGESLLSPFGELNCLFSFRWSVFLLILFCCWYILIFSICAEKCTNMPLKRKLFLWFCNLQLITKMNLLSWVQCSILLWFMHFIYPTSLDCWKMRRCCVWKSVQIRNLHSQRLLLPWSLSTHKSGCLPTPPRCITAMAVRPRFAPQSVFQTLAKLWKINGGISNPCNNCNGFYNFMLKNLLNFLKDFHQLNPPCAKCKMHINLNICFCIFTHLSTAGRLLLTAEKKVKRRRRPE